MHGFVSDIVKIILLIMCVFLIAKRHRITLGYVIPRQFGRGRMFSAMKAVEYTFTGKCRKFNIGKSCNWLGQNGRKFTKDDLHNLPKVD